MLHQIELYRLIPQMNEDIDGFMDETRSRLMDCSPHDYSRKSKYGNRLSKAQKAMEALQALHRCLNE